MHFSRVKDCVLVAIQRRNAGRAAHGILQNKKMREAKTALKSGSSPLALSSFPKLFDRLCVSRKGSQDLELPQNYSERRTSIGFC